MHSSFHTFLLLALLLLSNVACYGLDIMSKSKKPPERRKWKVFMPDLRISAHFSLIFSHFDSAE